MKSIIKLIGISIVALLTLVIVAQIFNGKKLITQNKESYVEISRSDDIKIDVEIRSENYGALDADEVKTIDIYQKLGPSVVNITYYKTEYINYFFEVYPERSEGQGSGAIIDKEGHVVTNYHVVGNADRVTVALSQNEDVYEADIIGVDPENDLAVIKIKNPPKNLIPIPLGVSKNLLVGQKVFAIGNPFGLDRTLTSGIISAVGRPIKTKDGNVIEGAIQTDASINPGNSGGPLIDSKGSMIGINTMIISPTGGSIGLGFAIPIDTAKDIISDLMKYGYVKRGWIDATFLPVNSKISRTLGYSVDYGLMIMMIARNGEAYNAGLRGGNERAIYGNQIVYIGGDIIVGIEGTKITNYSDFTNVLKNKKPGDVVVVDYIRNNRKYSTKVKLIDKGKFVQN
ncbi:MAG TPA: trypsin-like peptidase domain-containing protein [Spirochaetota bacterium]|nr:trypsin-like peptidase domain-containing protein [Spirochaetota bacterium]HOS33920.1 trypsin-like peptidase domain-containing protein [Spirochaetota bacterium]HOS56975.1 trypsin-like peptidase domain-containing protein [Spirochaetota bacterium]HPK63167.1 trypsin-like peptidase domain-containing protein [Spirochaetota bacterium]HQF78223.1 trypsin-like peptidase domain-containing protein [Spirochaetota bacterium]